MCFIIDFVTVQKIYQSNICVIHKTSHIHTSLNFIYSNTINNMNGRDQIHEIIKEMKENKEIDSQTGNMIIKLMQSTPLLAEEDTENNRGILEKLDKCLEKLGEYIEALIKKMPKSWIALCAKVYLYGGWISQIWILIAEIVMTIQNDNIAENKFLPYPAMMTLLNMCAVCYGYIEMSNKKNRNIYMALCYIVMILYALIFVYSWYMQYCHDSSTK